MNFGVCDFSRFAVSDWRLRRWRLWCMALMTVTLLVSPRMSAGAVRFSYKTKTYLLRLISLIGGFQIWWLFLCLNLVPRAASARAFVNWTALACLPLERRAQRRTAFGQSWVFIESAAVLSCHYAFLSSQSALAWRSYTILWFRGSRSLIILYRLNVAFLRSLWRLPPLTRTRDKIYLDS